MIDSTVSFACLAGTHDFCAREWKNRGEARTCGCRCHQDLQPAPPSGLMDFVQAFRRVFLACIPRPIEPDWDPLYAPRLAGFPVSICYASLRGELGPEYATYYFDPRTFAENSDDRRMRYYPRDPSRFRVEVVIRKADRHIETRKYRGEGLVCQSAGPDFRKARVHTTILGLLEDEPADERT